MNVLNEEMAQPQKEGKDGVVILSRTFPSATTVLVGVM
jgi:hypothetical protein